MSNTVCMEVTMAKSAKKGGNKILGIIFLALVVAGLVLVIVGMCIDVINQTTTLSAFGKETSKTIGISLFDDRWDNYKKLEIANNVFLIVSFIVAIVGLAVLALDAVIRVFMGKNLKIIRAVGALVTIVGAILILIAGLTTAAAFGKNFSADVNLGELAGGSSKFTAAAGVWLGFVGGLIGGVCGGLPLLKQFN